MDSSPLSFTAFAGQQRIAAGDLRGMLIAVKAYLDSLPRNRAGEPLLIFEDQSGRQVDFDFRGSVEEVVARAEASRTRSGPGRPKLGVVAREITLLPRHWEWLEQQPSGASAALRRLVDEARKHEPGEQANRQACEAANQFMTAMAGNLANYEEATRALFAGDLRALKRWISDWPEDISKHVLSLAPPAVVAKT